MKSEECAGLRPDSDVGHVDPPPLVRGVFKSHGDLNRFLRSRRGSRRNVGRGQGAHLLPNTRHKNVQNIFVKAIDIIAVYRYNVYGGTKYAYQ